MLVFFFLNFTGFTHPKVRVRGGNSGLWCHIRGVKVKIRGLNILKLKFQIYIR